MIDDLLGECQHKKCDQCGRCSAYLTECENRANDEMGRVTGPDKYGSTLHAECRRQIRLYGDTF